MIGIYKIQSILKPERIYIGSAINIKERWGNHLRSCKRNKHGNNRLQNHYNKYGVSDLVFSVLLECDKDSLLKTEQFFIDSYNPYFNICKTAGSQLGYRWAGRGKQKVMRTQEHKDNLSKSLKGHPSHNKGKHLSEEQKRLISISTKKTMSNPELREKLSKLKKGIKGIGMTGKHHSKETMQKIIGKTSKRIFQYTKDYAFIKEWPSIRQAARELSLYAGNIIACAKHKIKSSGGFLWEYKLKEEQL